MFTDLLNHSVCPCKLIPRINVYKEKKLVQPVQPVQREQQGNGENQLSGKPGMEKTWQERNY